MVVVVCGWLVQQQQQGRALHVARDSFFCVGHRGRITLPRVAFKPIDILLGAIHPANAAPAGQGAKRIVILKMKLTLVHLP